MPGVRKNFKNPELFGCRLEMGVNVYFIHTHITVGQR